MSAVALATMVSASFSPAHVASVLKEKYGDILKTHLEDGTGYETQQVHIAIADGYKGASPQLERAMAVSWLTNDTTGYQPVVK